MVGVGVGGVGLAVGGLPPVPPEGEEDDEDEEEDGEPLDDDAPGFAGLPGADPADGVPVPVPVPPDSADGPALGAGAFGAVPPPVPCRVSLEVSAYEEPSCETLSLPPCGACSVDDPPCPPTVMQPETASSAQAVAAAEARRRPRVRRPTRGVGVLWLVMPGSTGGAEGRTRDSADYHPG
ncbi:hypothetical protein BIV57_07345 [Mangrovactinospora gilvigrisea]|uniref:Uncharacterized protein n=1 Tax=Mangrovactinospora gilvigrisea TaxID=1428644 RepID=A0A1J7BHF7_9ACTN|nr:hypothetical protein BIV57_07345 [Mangrovactinospora gilvigrisea]